MSKIHFDTIGRVWVTCPNCGRKTPAWSSSRGYARVWGVWRWCGKEWCIKQLFKSKKHSIAPEYVVYGCDVVTLEEVDKHG